MEIIGGLIQQLFSIEFTFFHHTLTFAQFFVGTWVLGLIVWFLSGIFR